MGSISLPHTIENKMGEKLTFVKAASENGVEKVIVRAFCKPGAGPPMHVHYKQDEYLEVVKGRMGYQFHGEPEQFLTEGNGILFERGKPHRFWNAGEQEMELKGWVSPRNTIVEYLSAVYDAQNRGEGGRPENWDGAYLITNYSDEYDMIEIPGFVKKVIFPITVFIGNLLGKYKHLKAKGV